MKKYILLLLLSAVSFAGCQKEVEQNVGENGNAIPMSFYAGIEIPKNSISTRTVLGGASSDSYRNVLWKYQDEVYVTNGASSSKFVNTTEGSSDVALLEGELPPAADYYAAYPFDMVKGYSASGFKMELPSVQTYYPDGVSSGSFPMVAKCDDGIFSFRNLCGIFVLRLTGDETISSVTFSGKDASGKDISVAGNGTVSTDYSGNPTLIMEDAAVTSVTLKSSEGVRLNPSQPTAFHIVLPVGTYTTFNVIIKATDGTVMTVESKNTLVIKRSNRTSAAALTYSGVVIHYQDLNESGGTANSYIISSPGGYKFKAVKGNSSESVGEVSSVEVLWESFGTDVTPEVGDLVREVSHSDGYIQFSTPATFKEGNAVVAAKNSSGEILWSWHIWLTDQPEEQVYYNNAGTMMDRNLGATSSAPGDVGALGLLYQWGRKDPFLGSSDIHSNVVAKSTTSWPSAEASSLSIGTVDYVIKNPMTFIEGRSDWQYSSPNDELWNPVYKTIYDPCPAGWRVPRGGMYGVWADAYGSRYGHHPYDSTDKGMNFSGKFGNASTIWYPASGFRSYKDGTLWSVGVSGEYSSASPASNYMRVFWFTHDGYLCFEEADYRGYGYSVRCLKEGSSSSEIPSDPVMPTYEDLSVSGTANSYIVNEAGDYRFEAVKGNSSESVGEVFSVEVLWESFGTDVTPEVGDLVREVSHSDGYIQFSTPATFREGNAVIAAKDASGTILWSWHIWLTDAPEEQIYYNNAGTTMDRNLGATSATPGDVGALGLLYQWGRKDPFLGSSSISANEVAKSTATWPSLVKSSLSTGTIEYATENPMTFISENTSNYDWFYPSSSYNESYRWDKAKTRYDPCPNGWRIPNNGLWIMNSITNYIIHPFDNSNKGMDFSKVFGDATSIWYPAAGTKGKTGDLGGYGTSGNYWSVVGSGGNSAPSPYTLMIDDGDLSSATLVLSYYGKTSGHSVRCIKE